MNFAEILKEKTDEINVAKYEIHKRFNILQVETKILW